MRSGRLFEEDAGRKHPSREHKPMDQPAGSHDDWDVERPRHYGGGGGGGGGGNRNRGPGWFLHDDRDGQTGFNKPREGGRVAPVGQTPEEWEGNRGGGVDSGGGGSGGSRGGRGGGPAAASAPAPPPDVWFYKDPSGNEQGPFAAPKLLKWVEQGYFSSDLPVRKDPNRTFTPLDNLLDGLKAEAAAASAAVGRSTVRVLTVPAPKPVQREPRRNVGGNRRNRGGYDEHGAEPPARPDGRPHPAEALLSDGMRRPREQQRQAPRPQPADWDGIQQGGAGGGTNGRGTGAGRTGWEDSSPKAGAGGGGEDPGHDRPRGTAFGTAGGGTPRREARPRRAAAEGAAPDPTTKPKVSNSEWTIARKLFYVQGKQGAELPMWRYIDPAGACQGPFESMEMMKWFEGAFLKASLLICGTDRKVSPPNLPDPELYMTLGDNMARIRSGKSYKPITPADIREFRTGRKPWEVHDAEAAAAAAAAAPSSSLAPPQDAEEDEPETEEEDREVGPTTDLAASMGPAAPQAAHSSSRNGPAQIDAATAEADSSEAEEGEITDEPAPQVEAEEGDVRDVRGMRAAASDDEEGLDDDTEEDDDDSVGSLADVQEAPATPSAAEAASGVEHGQDQVPSDSTAAVSVQNAAASALTGAGTIAGGPAPVSAPASAPAASPAEQEQPREVPAPAAAAQQSPGSPTGTAAASEAASAAPAEAAASPQAQPAARSPARAASPAAASPPRGGGGGVTGMIGGLLSRLGGGGASAGNPRAEGASQAPVAAEQESQQGSLGEVTAESDSEDDEAQLEAAEHRAAYNLEAPSTAPATTGGSTTGSSTQTGSGLGTAAGGGNAVPHAAENGAAQPPAESNTQEDRGGSVLEAFSGDEQNEADAGDEVQDDDQPSHSPATARSEGPSLTQEQ